MRGRIIPTARVGIAVPEDLRGYRYATMRTPPAPALSDPGFEEGGKGWRLPAGYRIAPGEGRGGSAGLAYERPSPSIYVLATQAVELVPGARYRFGAWVRTENVTGDDSGGTVCVEFSEGGRYLGGSFPAGIKATTDWTHVEGTVVAPDRPVQSTLSVYLRRDMTGRVWFDDVMLTPEAPRVVSALVLPSGERLPAAGGSIVLALYREGAVPDAPSRAYRLRIGVEREGRSLRVVNAPFHDGRSVTDLGRLPEGPVTLRLTLVDPVRREILAQDVLPALVTGRKPASRSAVRIDAKGRTLVAERPFLPVGLYCSGVTARDLDRLARSPFNCLMPYGSLSLRLEGSGRTGLDGVRDVLDACAAHQVRVVFSIKDAYRGTQWYLPRYDAEGGESALVQRTVSALKDHPALLAWYINDELPTTMLDRLIARRRQVNRLDPDHPTWAVLYQFGELPLYAPTADILGVDPYPIRDASTHSMERVRYAMEMARRAIGTSEDGMALWAVPQIFNWGVYDARARRDLTYYHERFRDPTEEEMRSMALLMALMGARGFFFYSYPDLFRPPDTTAFRRRWPEICRVAEQLVGLAPFLLSERSGPAISLVLENGEVQARAYADRSGQLRVLVAGVGPGDSRAVLHIDTKTSLRSRFGRCVSLGGGRYRFAGTDISSDILESA